MGDNGRKVVETRLPAERRPDPLAYRDDLGGIACPPRRLLDLEIDFRDVLDRLDDFQRRETAAVAAIERQRWSAGSQMAQCIRVRTNEIADINVVADAGAVRRRIIGAENLELRPQPQGRLGRNLDQMGGTSARGDGRSPSRVCGPSNASRPNWRSKGVVVFYRTTRAC